MTRLFAILGAVFCFGMILPTAATENVRGGADLQMAVIHGVCAFITGMSLFLYCGFAALHSVARVQDPIDRMGWVVFTLGANVLGSLFYYLTKYQDFRSHGMGGLPLKKGKGDHPFYRATPSELNAAAEWRDSDEAVALAKIIRKRIAMTILAFVVPVAAVCYLLYFPFALSDKVEELMQNGEDFSSAPVFRFFWAPANHLHDSWSMYRDYNHDQLKNLPNYEGIVWLIK